MTIGKMNLLKGFDEHGVVYDGHDNILRKILPGYVQQAREIFELYKYKHLSTQGVVETTMIDNQTFQHKKYLISYPHEWTISMFKQSLLFHLELFLTLEKHGLTLKDALPQNILFDHTKPVFVDFLSLIKKEDIGQETWLKKVSSREHDPQKIIFWAMFFPYFLVPFVLMTRKDYSTARDMIFSRACNCGAPVPSWVDLLAHQGRLSRTEGLAQVVKLFFNLKKQARKEVVALYAWIFDWVKDCNIIEKQSAYSEYYAEKKEDLNFEQESSWMPKQMGVLSVLKKYKPATVLDLGANAGWFSLLAVHEGARVIATDIDEVSIDILYQQAKQKNLPILSLCMSFTDFAKQKFGYIPQTEEYKNRSFERPLFLPATERLSCDMVLCLALIHHLILGQGLAVEYVMKILAMLTQKVLVLEFVDLDDEKIREEPSFFKCLSQHSKNSYNLDCVVTEGKKYFEKVEIILSHPQTRTILIFER